MSVSEAASANSGKAYKIGSLQVENFMKISAVYIKADGNLIEITGENGAGKTSILTAIWGLIDGKRALPDQPIRAGEEKALIRAELGDLIVTRYFGAKEDGYTTEVVIESTDGARYRRPQDILNTITGALSFDPLAVLKMDRKAQFEMFRTFVPGIDFDHIDGLNKKDFDERTEVNRKANAAKARAEAIAVPKDAPTEKIDESALIEELQRAGEVNADLQSQYDRRAHSHGEAERLRSQASGMRAHVENLRRQIAEAEATIAELDGRVIEIEQKLAEAPAIAEPVDVSAIRQKIDNAKQQNALVERVLARRALDKEAANLEERSDELTEAIRVRKEQMEAEIAAAEMPVEGLSLADGVVTFNGLPLDQASHADQIRVSVAIAAALNPKLKMALVHDGSTLDRKSWALLAELADKYDFQLFVETVDSSRPGAIVIEDGHLKQMAEAAE